MIGFIFIFEIEPRKSEYNFPPLLPISDMKNVPKVR